MDPKYSFLSFLGILNLHIIVMLAREKEQQQQKLHRTAKQPTQ